MHRNYLLYGKGSLRVASCKTSKIEGGRGHGNTGLPRLARIGTVMVAIKNILKLVILLKQRKKCRHTRALWFFESFG